MTTLYSTPAQVTITNLPYSVPGSGQALAIGTNTADALIPPTQNAFDWNYTVFESWSGGCYVRDYSAFGAYVLCNTGGHEQPPNFGAALFDFSTATWVRVDNANGMPWQAADLTTSQLTGAPYWEISSSSFPTVTGNMPAPSHMYLNALALPASLGGGAKGSVITVFCSREAYNPGTGNYPVTSYYSHRFDLATGLWTRQSNNAITDGLAAFGGTPPEDAPSCFDPNTNRYYQLPFQIWALNALPYLDSSDWNWKSASLGGYPGVPENGQNAAAFIDPTRSLLIMQMSASALYAIDLTNIGGGVKVLNVTGTMPSKYVRWDYYPVDGCFYTYDGSGSSSIFKLAPPSSSPLTSTWTASTVAIGGAGLPAQSNVSNNGSSHYSRFFYVAPLQCFAWIAGGTNQVVLVKP
jgi:hypothetical protein